VKKLFLINQKKIKFLKNIKKKIYSKLTNLVDLGLIKINLCNTTKNKRGGNVIISNSILINLLLNDVEKKMEFINFITKIYFNYLEIFPNPCFRLWFLIILCSLCFNNILKFYLEYTNGSKTKRTYFAIYVIAVSFILSQCLLLISSNNTDTSDRGILLLYVYITATLMLFLIFLALTTNESYLEKELKNNQYNQYSIKIGTSNYIFYNKIILTLPVIILYFYLMIEFKNEWLILNEILEINTNLKEKILFSPEFKFITNYNDYFKNSVSKENFIYYKSTNNNKQTYVWNSFIDIKNSIESNSLGYALSALLQSCTLFLIIISLLI